MRMLGEKAQSFSKKVEPLKTALDFGQYIVGALALFGITGAVAMTWFGEQINWF